MNYEGEIGGVVEKDNEKFLLIDSEKPMGDSKKYSNRHVCLVKINEKIYKKLEKLYAKKAFEERKKTESEEKFSTRTQKILDSRFEIRADKDFFFFLSSGFLNGLKNFSMSKKGARCLSEVGEKDIRRIEGLESKDPGEVEKTIEMLAEIRADLSEVKKWKRILKKNNIRIALVFPFYNEPSVIENIRDVWDLIEEEIIEEIIIADGWSGNPSTDLIKRRLDAPLTVVKNPGTGKGEALESAIKYALHQDFDLVVCLDSDIKPPLHKINDIPPLPLDITCNFFARKFIFRFLRVLEKHGKRKALGTYYKASYMRIQKKGNVLTPLRFGGTTIYVKKLYKMLKFRSMDEFLYPLSGEYAFNPEFLLKELSVSRNFFELFGRKYHGPGLPTGFTIENFWNVLMEIKGLNVAFCNMFIHHHTPRKEKSKDPLAYAKQRGTVFRGAFGAILQSLPEEEAKKYVKYFDFDLFRLPRPKLRVEIDGKSVKNIKFMKN
ncbi:MAG: glycosyltransferase [Candidatus Aenigmarchaeota archaeon]